MGLIAAPPAPASSPPKQGLPPTLMAAAEGAVAAYIHITGETWKPCEPPVAGPATVGRQAAEAEIAAFGRDDPGGGREAPALLRHRSPSTALDTGGVNSAASLKRWRPRRI
jgi:hypothetical protein